MRDFYTLSRLVSSSFNPAFRYLKLGKFHNPEDTASWLEEADILASASAKLALRLPSKELSFDALLKRSIELYSSASSEHRTHDSSTQLATHLLRRAVIFRDLSETSSPDSLYAAQADSRAKTLFRKAKQVFLSSFLLNSVFTQADIHQIRQIFSKETTKLFYKYEIAPTPRGAPAFAKALSQPLLWQNLLVSLSQDGRDVEIWDVSKILSRPTQLLDANSLPHAALKVLSSPGNQTIRTVAIESDLLFVADDSSAVRVWSLRAIRNFLHSIKSPPAEGSSRSSKLASSSSSSPVGSISDAPEIEFVRVGRTIPVANIFSVQNHSYRRSPQDFERP